jgi:hypothetical protein
MTVIISEEGNQRENDCGEREGGQRLQRRVLPDDRTEEASNTASIGAKKEEPTRSGSSEIWMEWMPVI